MSDYGAEYTEEQIKKIEREVKKVYSQAKKEINAKVKDFTNKYESEDKKFKSLVDSGEKTKKEYKEWKQKKIFESKEWKQKKKDINNILTNSNQKAVEIANGKLADVFSTNVNWANYEIDSKTNMGINFTIYDTESVSRLIRENPSLLPHKVDVPKDKAWNEKLMNTQVKQSIIQGESIDKLAYRLGGVVGREKDSMMTIARTMMTSAQNGGRMHSYREAKKIGINVYKKWLSAHDGHTRNTHLILDDEDPIPIEEPFEVNGQYIDYPGDPYAPPALVYNCRCTMISEIVDEDGNTLYSINEDELDAVGFAGWIEESENIASGIVGEIIDEDVNDVGSVVRETRSEQILYEGFESRTDVRNNLSEFNELALQQIMKDTGYGREEAKILQDDMIEYFGGDYVSFTEGRQAERVARIDEGLSKMPIYDGGSTYRGMKIDRSDPNEFALLSIGDDFKMKSISSWSSSKEVSEDFANLMDDYVSSIFIECVENKSAVPVQHISSFYTQEAEVLAPSSAVWKVIDTNKTNFYDYMKEKVEKQLETASDKLEINACISKLNVLDKNRNSYEKSEIIYIKVKEN